ncbi:MAG: ExbD/TolR family protein [Chthoniobacterales bacterium]|jgi:biopolymer transport protein ExbD
MAGGGGGLEKGEPDFQIAPMVDVLLVILIFFMTITSAQVLNIDKEIKLPLAAEASKKDDSRSEAIINVRWDPETSRALFNFQDRIYPKASEFVDSLKSAKALGEQVAASKPGQNPEFRVVIRGDRDVPALFVSQAMNAAAEAGISDISFSAVNHD